MSLNSGERQVTPDISKIRRDHVARYEFVSKQINPGSRVIDYACGTGYGCKILNDAGHFAHGRDIDPETVEYAKANFCDKVEIGDGANPGELDEFDCAVSFETIEHIEDPRDLLKALRDAAPTLYASVPNEAVMPWRRADGAATAFHYRHYTKSEFEALLNECGWHVRAWYGQQGPESEVEADVDGRTLIAVCEHGEVINPRKHIAILGLGQSVDQFLDICKRKGGRSAFCDQVWSINALGDVFASDLIFHMDDIRIQEIRAKAQPESNIAAMVRWIKNSNTPIVTSRAHPQYPALVEFPLEAVLNNLGLGYFNSTAAYAIAFAIYVEATDISVFGMDFTYANRHDGEKGRACVEFWLGQAHARGIKLNFPKTTSLMDSMNTQQQRLYGYDTVDVDLIEGDNATVSVKFTPRTKLPTAEEIERAYDHSAPMEKQHIIEVKA